MDIEVRQEILDFKQTFDCEAGKRVLDRLARYCMANLNQSMFDASSETQTAYNLGAHSVYRYIMSRVLADLDPSKETDCIIEEDKTENDK